MIQRKNDRLLLRYHVGDNCVLFLNQADFRHDVEQRLVRVPVIKAFPGDPGLFCDPNQLQLILCVPVYLPCLIAVEAKQSSHLRSSHGSLFGNFVPFTVITVPIPVLRSVARADCSSVLAAEKHRLVCVHFPSVNQYSSFLKLF